MTSRLPSDIDAIVSDGNHTIFHPFPRLPIELRRKIWLLYLTDTESAPQIYRFDLRYPERVYYRNSIRHIHVYAGDQIFLQPSRCYGAGKDSGVLEPLRASSAIRQIASATCVEARLAVLELFPDTLKFRNLPQGWTEVKSGKKTIGSPDGVGFPEYILRFNSLKDIIVLHATWEDQNAAIEISKLRGSPPADFAKLSHVGVGVNDFRMYGLVPVSTGAVRPSVDARRLSAMIIVKRTLSQDFSPYFHSSRHSMSQASQGQASTTQVEASQVIKPHSGKGSAVHVQLRPQGTLGR